MANKTKLIFLLKNTEYIAHNWNVKKLASDFKFEDDLFQNSANF